MICKTALGEVHYKKISSIDRPTLVFLHGFCETSLLWQDTISYLSQEYCCVSFDLPGFGKSKNSNFTTINEVATQLWVILKDELGISNAQFVGHSLGGYIAAQMAVQQPKCTKALSLVHSCLSADSATKKEQRKKTIAFLKKNGNEQFLKEFTKGLTKPEHLARLKNKIEEMVFPQDTNKMVEATNAMMLRESMLPQMVTLQIPTQYIVGAFDSYFSIHYILEEVSQLDNVQVDVMQESGHLAIWEQPSEFMTALSQFLKQILH